MRIFLWPILFLQAAVSFKALAWPPTYGTEFNFSNNELSFAFSERIQTLGVEEGMPPTRDIEGKWVKILADKIYEACKPKCRKYGHLDKFQIFGYKFEFENGMSININADPKIVEIQTNPETLVMLKGRVDFYEALIFKKAKEAGFLISHLEDAHFNIGIKSAFEDNPKAFLNFFVDYANRPELAEGIFGQDHMNAPAFWRLEANQQRALSEIVSDVDKDKVTTLFEMIDRINRKVYTRSPGFKEGSIHYQAVGLKYISSEFELKNKDLPMELRAVRQPLSAHEY